MCLFLQEAHYKACHKMGSKRCQKQAGTAGATEQSQERQEDGDSPGTPTQQKNMK